MQYHSQCVFSRIVLAGKDAIPSQLLIAPTLIRFLKSLKLFKAALETALMTSVFGLRLNSCTISIKH